jgi:hypothetical protein
MPYELKKKRGVEKYWVITTTTGKKHSIEPLSKARAEAQMRALYAAEGGYILGKKKPMKK